MSEQTRGGGAMTVAELFKYLASRSRRRTGGSSRVEVEQMPPDRPTALTPEEREALVWLVDFVLDNPRDPLRGTKWPALLLSSKEKLLGPTSPPVGPGTGG